MTNLPKLTEEVYSSLTLEQAQEVLKPYLSELQQMGMELHKNHTNVGPVNRLKEWSECKYSFCKRRYEMVFGSETGKLTEAL